MTLKLPACVTWSTAAAGCGCRAPADHATVTVVMLKGRSFPFDRTSGYLQKDPVEPRDHRKMLLKGKVTPVTLSFSSDKSNSTSVIRRGRVNNCKRGPSDDSFLFLIVFHRKVTFYWPITRKKKPKMKQCSDKLLLLNSAQEVLQQPRMDHDRLHLTQCLTYNKYSTEIFS